VNRFSITNDLTFIADPSTPGSAAEGLIEYEYREAEYKYEESPNNAEDTERRSIKP